MFIFLFSGTAAVLFKIVETGGATYKLQIINLETTERTVSVEISSQSKQDKRTDI